LGVLQNLEEWSSWLPGAVASEVVNHTNAVVVELVFSTPYPIAVSVDVTDHEDGVRFRMVEGDLAAVDGEVSVTDHEDGCSVRWRMSLAFPRAIPGSLLAELEREIIPAWCQALLRAARSGSDRSDG